MDIGPNRAPMSDGYISLSKNAKANPKISCLRIPVFFMRKGGIQQFGTRVDKIISWFWSRYKPQQAASHV